MRRVFLLVASCLVMSLVFASAAAAQQVTAEDFRQGGTGGYGCSSDQYFATAPGDPGEGTGACFDTAEAAAIYSNTGEVPQSPSQQLPEEYGAVTANGAELAPLNADGTCPPGFVSVNAPFCAQESPNTPGRIFGYGEGDLAGQDPCTVPFNGARGFDSADADCVAEELETPQNTAQPSAAAQGETVTNLPDTGGFPLSGVAAGFGFLLVTGGLLLRRRLS